MDFLSASKQIAAKMQSIPKIWDGKQAILEMKQAGFSQWRQMEWIGFYFEFLCRTHLSSIMEIPGPRYGNTSFDGLFEIPWDFKAHAMNTSSHQIIVNDYQSIFDAIAEYGAVGVILAMGEVEYNDEKRKFQKWHNKLKGGLSDYEKERIERGAWSRLRKRSFDLRQISYIRLTRSALKKTGSFQYNFRNADGSPRKSKVLINLEKLQNEIIYFQEF